ncbi:50S ribosomal protein L39e [Thermocladium modestius]|nr:50S ribosomal protein L39e [Thermocladium modestius]
MASHKPLGRKLRLSAAARRNRNPPSWVVVKTNRRVTLSYTKRNWRRNKLGI